MDHLFHNLYSQRSDSHDSHDSILEKMNFYPLLYNDTDIQKYMSSEVPNWAPISIFNIC